MFAALSLALSPASAQAPDILEPLRTGQRAPGDAAVVIGIERYPFVSDVPHAQRDAQAMYNLLVYTRGVPADRVRLLDRGANREQILEAVADAGRKVGQDGAVWVYFAGHGAADTTSGERLLLGDDVRQDASAFSARGMSVKAIQDAASAGGGAVNLIVDACYAGVGRSGEELLAGKRFLVPAYAISGNPRLLEWSAAAPNELSGPLNQAQHGAFTYFAVGALRGWADGQLDGVRDGKVTAEEAKLYVNQALRTVQVTDQQSQLTATDPSRLVLSASDQLETGPSASAIAALRDGATTSPVPTPGPSPAPGGAVDAANRAALSAYVEGVLRDCYVQHAGGRADLLAWTVRFRVHPKKGFNGLLMNAPQLAETDSAPAMAMHTCIRGELRSQSYKPGPAAITFNNAFTLPADLATAPLPVPAPPSTTPEPNPLLSTTPRVPDAVRFVIRNANGDWADVRVNGAVVAEFRNERELVVELKPGLNAVEIVKFMEESPFVAGRLVTGRAREITCGISLDAGMVCYDHDGWTPR